MKHNYKFTFLFILAFFTILINVGYSQSTRDTLRHYDWSQTYSAPNYSAQTNSWGKHYGHGGAGLYEFAEKFYLNDRANIEGIMVYIWGGNHSSDTAWFRVYSANGKPDTLINETFKIVKNLTTDKFGVTPEVVWFPKEFLVRDSFFVSFGFGKYDYVSSAPNFTPPADTLSMYITSDRSNDPSPNKRYRNVVRFPKQENWEDPNIIWGQKGNFLIAPIINYDTGTAYKATITTTLKKKYCAGEEIDIAFSASRAFNTGNKFILQFSKEDGTWGKALNLDTYTGVKGDTFHVKLPQSLTEGYFHRFRVVSTDPAINHADNGFDIQVSEAPPKPLLIKNGRLLLSSKNEVGDGGFNYDEYTWKQDGNVVAAKSNDTTYTAKESGSYSVTHTSWAGCKSTSDTVYVFAGVAVKNISPALTPCPGDTIYVAYDLSYAANNFKTGNDFVVEMSDNLGSFDSPTILGSLTSQKEDSIMAVIPASQASGNYKIRVTSTDPVKVGREYDKDLTVGAVPSTPTISLSGSTLTSSTADQYQWYYEGTLINGANGKTYNPTQKGNYTVKVWNAAGCWAISSPYNYNITGIPGYENYFSVFPNPVKENLSIQFNGEYQMITLYNSVGKVVYSEIVSGRKTININMENLNAGIYLLELKNEGNRETIKVVKE